MSYSAPAMRQPQMEEGAGEVWENEVPGAPPGEAYGGGSDEDPAGPNEEDQVGSPRPQALPHRAQETPPPVAPLHNLRGGR